MSEQKNSGRHSPLRFIGGLFYTLGYGAEYVLVVLWRALRNGFLFVLQLLAWALRMLGGWLGALVRGIARDLWSPFRRFGRRRRQLRRLRERSLRRARAPGEAQNAAYRRVHLKNSLQLATTLLAYLLPLLAAGVLVFTVSSIAGMNYALRVEMNGRELGFVADQNVVEGAKGLLRDRIRLAGNQALSDWQLNPTYSLAYARRLTTTQELVDEILTSSTHENDITRATGVTIGGELFGVTTEGEKLQAYLDGILQRAGAAAPPGASVNFVQSVVCDPPNEYAYFLSSVEDYDTLIARLGGNEHEGVSLAADGARSLADIARDNALTVDTLRRRNPQLAEAADDFVPEAGAELLITRDEPVLQVETRVRVQRTEEIPFTSVEIATAERAIGTRHTVQAGVPGQQQVWDDEYYIDGELVRSQRVDELTEVQVQPVDEIVEVGTYDYSDVPTSEFGTYVFPVPASTWSSRGILSYHRGMDINAPTGTPIFACNEGDVEIAGWHWSYGWYVILAHQDGLHTLYGHLSSLAVETGQHVMREEYLGAMGSTGTSSTSTSTRWTLSRRPRATA